MPLAVDPDEGFINVKSVAVASVSSLQSVGINRAEFNTPETDCFAADSDAPLGQRIFDIAVTLVRAIAEPDGVGNDIWWGT